jgi:hypothetical protein
MLVLGLALAAALCVAGALAVAWRAYRGRPAPLTRASAFVLDCLYLPLKMLFAAARGVPKLDAMMVALRNRANARRFRRAHRRVLFAPQCLRDIACPAPSSRRGIVCQRCGKCKVAAILAEAERLGYRFYLLTGSSFVPTIIEEERPDAALLLACPYECNKVMMALGRLPAVAVCLDRDGCVATDVRVDDVLEALRRGLEPAPEPA